MSATDFHAQTASQGSRGGFVTRILTAIGNGFVSIAESNHRVRRVNRLSAMSDAELAARGLKREDIVRHVFSDVLYI